MLAVGERWEETRAEGGESLGPSLVPGNQRVDAIAIGETEDGCRDPMLVVCGGWEELEVWKSTYSDRCSC